MSSAKIGSQTNSVDFLSLLKLNEEECIRLKQALDNNEKEIIENDLNRLTENLNDLSNILETLNGRYYDLASQLWSIKREIGKLPQTKSGQFSAALLKYQKQLVSTGEIRKRSPSFHSTERKSRKKSSQKSKRNSKKFFHAPRQSKTPASTRLRNLRNKQILNLSNSQIAIRSEDAVGSGAMSKTEHGIGRKKKKEKNEIRIRTPLIGDEADDSQTEKSLNKDGNIVLAKNAPMRVQEMQSPSRSGIAIRTAPPSEGFDKFDGTETTVNTVKANSEIAQRTATLLKEGQVKFSPTEQTIYDDKESNNPSHRKPSIGSHRKSPERRKKSSKSKRKKQNKRSSKSKILHKQSSSEMTIRTARPEVVMAQVSKTELLAKSLSAVSASDYSIRSDRAICTPPLDGLKLSATEEDIEDYRSEHVTPSVMNEIYGTKNAAQVNMFKVYDIPKICKVFALIVIVSIFFMIFCFQIRRIFDAITTVYEVSVDDCSVAYNLCHRYGMCCFNQCGNNRFDIFWSKLFG